MIFSTLASKPDVSILLPISTVGIFPIPKSPTLPTPPAEGVEPPVLGKLLVPPVLLEVKLFISSNPLISPFISFFAFLALAPAFLVALLALFNPLLAFVELAPTLPKEVLNPFGVIPKELLTLVAPFCALPKRTSVMAEK